MEIKCLTLPPANANCYVVEEDNTCVIIDAPSKANVILDYISKKGLSLSAILLTHGHFDHIDAIDELSEKTEAQVYIHQNDYEMLYDSTLNASSIFGLHITKKSAAKKLNDNDTLAFGKIKIKVLLTPGHTKGSVCYIINDNIFTGDTLFQNGYGRTDLPGGNSLKLVETLKKLIPLSKGMKVFPGHNY